MASLPDTVRSHADRSAQGYLTPLIVVACVFEVMELASDEEIARPGHAIAVDASASRPAANTVQEDVVVPGDASVRSFAVLLAEEVVKVVVDAL